VELAEVIYIVLAYGESAIHDILSKGWGFKLTEPLI
jgi:hypothetical protein